MVTGYQLQLRFSITQKDLYVIKPIGALFNKRVLYNKKGFYYFILTDNENLIKLVNYINLNPLLTKKKISFIKWLKLYNIFLKKEHLLIKPCFLKKQVLDINKFRY